MSFLYPAFLTALSAILIPILIHLFNFRKYKKVYFTNVKFLKEINQKTQSQSQLRHYLVLASRILAIAFLVLAFAQPYIPVKNFKITKGQKTVSIFVDNSFSMDAINKNGSLLDEAKKRAVEIAAAYGPADKFQLLTNDFEGKHQRLVNKEEFLEWLDELKISPNVKSLSQIHSRQADAFGSAAGYRRAFIISDFQKSICDFSEIKNDTSIKTVLVPILNPEVKNIFIDSLWFDSPVRQASRPEKLFVRILNNSAVDLDNFPIKLFINGKQKTLTSININANSSATAVLSYSSSENGFHQCQVIINDYPVTFDDKFYFSYDVKPNIPVLTINSGLLADQKSPGSYVASLFGNDSLFLFSEQEENKLDYSGFNKNSLIVLNELNSISSGLAQELQKFVKNGESLFVIPGTQMDFISYHLFLNMVNSSAYERIDTTDTKVKTINFDHELYRDVFEKRSENIDLPLVPSHYKISKEKPGEELLTLANGDAFLDQYNFSKGKIYQLAVPLSGSFSNFPRHSLFVPTLYKIAIYSQAVKPLFYTIGNSGIIEIPGWNSIGDNVFHIINADNFDLIPGHKAEDGRTDIYLNNGITKAGNYFLKQGESLIGGLSFNYDRKESALEAYSNANLNKETESHSLYNFSVIEPGNKPLTAAVAEIDQGKKLWKLCIILALLFLAAETFLLRFRKTQTTHEPAT